uniref:VWFA domain-containing protein n=1 Tax=Caenorhabditis tropicalis TaxID=1561998 RepID=A0A1I7UTE9_9PELO
MKLSILLATVSGCLALYDPSSYTDRPCGDDITNLWLDVVAVVDNSKGMRFDGLQSIAASLVSVFGAGTRIGVNSTEKRTTRVGLVSYNEKARVNADLTTYTSFDDLFSGVYTALNDVSSTELSYLSNGLGAAADLFKKQSFGTTRDHYKKVVIVFASAFKGSGDLDPLPVAEKLRTDGAFIVTVAYDQDGNGDLMDKLNLIATPGFNFSNTEEGGNLIGKIQGALMQSNCFCPNNYDQYRVSFADKFSYRYGSCLLPVNIAASWKPAQMSCRNRKAYLATEFTQHKHDFIVKSVSSTTGFHPPLSYHIGLNQVLGKWVWDQPQGLPQIELRSWFNWSPTYPKKSSSFPGVQNLQNSNSTQWQNIDAFKVSTNYICEAYACDTDNYCDDNGTL